MRNELGRAGRARCQKHPFCFRKTGSLLPRGANRRGAHDLPFKDGPGAETARAYCLTCHSAEYVYMQPPLARATWQAEVVKMKAAYGATIPDAAVGEIVDYLVSQNGPKT